MENWGKSIAFWFSRSPYVGQYQQNEKSARETLENKLNHISCATLAFGKVIHFCEHEGPRYPRDFYQPDFNRMIESD
jgi:hypothetical protein